MSKDVKVTVEEIEENGFELTTISLDSKGSSGAGKIVLQETASGWNLYFPQICNERLALLDLYHNSEESRNEDNGEEHSPLQIIIDDSAPYDDSIARIRFLPKGTKIDFFDGVCNLKTGREVDPSIEFGILEDFLD